MRIDGRTLTHEASEAIRLMAVRRVKEGERPSEVIKSYGLCRTTVYKWLRAAARGGEAALAARKAGGPPGRLRAGQKQQVRRWICGKDPRQHGFDFGLWTRKIVAALIERRMGVRLSLTSVGRLLAELDITPQKPLRRAYERDPGAIEAWKCAAYPALEQRARRCGADIFFLDEAGIRSDAPLQRTWGARGRTPVVATSGQRQSVNAISAVNRLGAFWYNVYSGRLNAAQSILFLKDFVRYRRRPVFLVVDRHPAHIAKIVAEHVQSLGGRLELHFLPGYAPDLNPDEFVWNHLRQKGISKTPLRQNESLRARVEADLAAIHADPPLVRFFFFSGSQCSLYYGLSSIGAWAIVGDPSDSDDGYFAGAVHLIPLPIDCNNNGVSDACDIATRASSDANADGVPDDCQPNSCPLGGCENLDIAAMTV